MKKHTVLFSAILNFLALFIVLTTVFFILFNADFELGDDSELLTSICNGIPHTGLRYQNDIGRFNWSRSEYNILLLTPFFRSPLAFYFIAAAQFIIFSLFSFLILQSYLQRIKSLNERSVAILLWCIWFLSVFFQIKLFFLLVRPEKLLVTILMVFMWLILRSDRGGWYRKKGGVKDGVCKLVYWMAFWGIGLIVSVLVFCKEPVFGSALVCSTYIFLFMRKNKVLKMFAVWLAFAAILYIVLYLFFVLPKTVSRYGKTGYSYLQASVLIIRYCPLLVLPLALSFAVLVKTIRGLFNGTFNPCIEDALLLSGAAYSVAFLVLRMVHDDYFRPVFILAFPAFLSYGIKVSRLPFFGRSAAIGLCVLLCSYYLHKGVVMAEHRVKDGHSDMIAMKKISQLCDSESKFLCYDDGNDSSASCRLASIPAFIKYINGDDYFDFTIVQSVPVLDTPDAYAISLCSIPEYSSSNIGEVVSHPLHVYKLGRDGK